MEGTELAVQQAADVEPRDRFMGLSVLGRGSGPRDLPVSPALQPSGQRGPRSTLTHCARQHQLLPNPINIMLGKLSWRAMDY
jgi:hypothetical protein